MTKNKKTSNPRDDLVKELVEQLKNTPKDQKTKLTSSILEKAYKAYSHFSKYIVDEQINESTRYSSWDLCYNHFQKFFKTEPTPQDIRMAALHLGFYLASWGMLRNSELLNYGIRKYEELAIELFRLEQENLKDQYEGIKLFLQEWKVQNMKDNLGEIELLSKEVPESHPSKEELNNLLVSLGDLTDEQKINDQKVCEIVKLSESIRKSLNSPNKDYKILRKELVTTPTVTLITKIMLGVYANTPAFDTNFNRSVKNFCDLKGIKILSKKIDKIFETEVEKFETEVEKKEFLDSFLKSFIKNLPVQRDFLKKEKVLDAMFFEIGRVLDVAKEKAKPEST